VCQVKKVVCDWLARLLLMKRPDHGAHPVLAGAQSLCDDAGRGGTLAKGSSPAPAAAAADREQAGGSGDRGAANGDVGGGVATVAACGRRRANEPSSFLPGV